MPATAADILFTPVTELAAHVRAGELSSRELVQTSLDRIEELNPQLNAFVDVFAEDALAEADGIAADDPRPFAGVPIAIKNNRAIAGKRLTFAAELMGDFIAPADHNTVRRLKDAGFVIVGSTTLPEYGILPVTETARFGADPQPVGPRAHAGRLLRRLARPRSRRAWCPSPTPTTGAAPPASPRRAAASSASSPSADGSRSHPTSATSSSCRTAC